MKLIPVFVTFGGVDGRVGVELLFVNFHACVGGFGPALSMYKPAAYLGIRASAFEHPELCSGVPG